MNICRPHIHIRHARTEVDFFQPTRAMQLNRVIFATSALHRTAVPSCAPYMSVERARSTQGFMPSACMALRSVAHTTGCRWLSSGVSTACASRGGRSCLRLACARSGGAGVHEAKHSNGAHRTGALSTVPPPSELMLDWSDTGGRHRSLQTVRVGWHGQHASGGGSRMSVSSF